MPLPLLALLGLIGAGTATAGSAIGAARRSGQARNPLDDESDADVIDPAPDGAFMSFLDAFGHTGHAVNDVLVGNFEGAGRQAVDLLGDVADSVLPGDWIPHISRRKDKATFSDVLGGIENPVGKFAADVIGGAATDPTSYIPGAAVGKALGVAGKVAGAGVALADKVVPGAADAVAAGGRLLRSTAGAPRLSPEVRQIFETAKTAKTNEAQSGINAIKGSVLATLSPEERNIVGDVIDNYRWEDGKVVGRIGPESEDPITLLARHPDLPPEALPRMRDAVAEAMHIGQQQAKRANVFSKRTAPDPLLFGATTEPQTAFHGDYLGKGYVGQTEEQKINAVLGVGPESMGGAGPLKARTLETPEETASYLAANPSVSFDRDAVSRLVDRAETQGNLAQRAEIGKAIHGPDFALADADMKAAVNEHIRGMAATDPESAKHLYDAFNGMAPRGKVMSAIVKMTTPFKKAAVYGFGIPRFGAIVSNGVSGLWQALANPEARQVALQQAGKLDSTIVGAVADSLGLSYPRDKLQKVLQLVDWAHGQSGGLTENALGHLDRLGTQEGKDAAMLMRSGALQGYVRGEDMIKEMARTPFQKKLANVLDWPGRMFRGVEDRMRAGMLLDLTKRGMPMADAARVTSDSLYSYDVNSVANRNARSFVPFFQFSAKAVPQAAKFMAEQPAVAGALSRSYEHDPDQPVYPYMEGRLNLPIGQDETGNDEYISSLRLPFESLSQIPNSFRDFKRNVIGSSNPLLKSLYANVSGEDPYFETPVGSYDKIPAFGHAGKLGRAYNQAAGAGLIQPLDSFLRPIDTLLDSRKGAGEKALSLTTGAHVVSVDPDLAQQQQLQELLKSNPDVQQYHGYFANQGDDATQALIRSFQEAKARVKAKRKAAARPVD